MNTPLTEKEREILRGQLRNELTESIVYQKLSERVPAGPNRDLLHRIGLDEKAHAERIAAILGETLPPRRAKAWFNVFVTRAFGLTFGLKLMENGEGSAAKTYRLFAESRPELIRIAEEEDAHEAALLDLLDDERLNYMGAIVLGLNDALVELTGALAGFTFALSRARLIAVTGLITGLAAAMSMSVSAFLSAEADVEAAAAEKHPVKTAAYTGIAYAVTVAILILPYLLVPRVKIALALMLCNALVVIALFNFYLSVARGTPFKKSFFRMAGLSTLIAGISFGIGYVLKMTVGC